MLLSQFKKKLHTAATNYVSILRECVEISNLRKAKTVHAKLIKTSEQETDFRFIHNLLIHAYVKCGDVINGRQVFEKMPEKNVVSWTVLIAGFVRKGFPIETVSLFYDMHKSSIRPNEYTFVSVLQACSFAESLHLICALQIFALIIRLGFEGNVYLVNSFLTILIRDGKLDEAIQVFQGCFNRDIVSWNAIFNGFLKFSCDYMDSGVKCCPKLTPDNFTYATVLTGLAELSNLETGLKVHALLVKSGYGAEMCVGNALVDMYLKSRRLNDGFAALAEMTLKDVCSWTQMAAGCLNYGEPVEALRVIGEMRRAGVGPNKFTLATGLNVCANMSSLDEGLKVHTLVIKLGDDVDVCVDNALLNMYSKCGCMDAAFRVFGSMSECSVVSWTTMIMGCAQNGRSAEALQIFEDMKKVDGVKPNHITMICVLYACSQGGYIDRGLEYFSSMREEYGVVPEEGHYVCVVNLLGRAGRIKEAEEFILQLPFRPSVAIWQTLLGACRVHGDIETAKRAAEQAVAIDNKDASTYVLLSIEGMDKEDEAYVHEAFLADWMPENNVSSGIPACLQSGEGSQAREHSDNSVYGDTQSSMFSKTPAALRSSNPQVVLRPYRARRPNAARLVRLAPDLPTVNLPPSVRVMSQSAFKSSKAATSVNMVVDVMTQSQFPENI